MLKREFKINLFFDFLRFFRKKLSINLNYIYFLTILIAGCDEKTPNTHLTYGVPINNFYTNNAESNFNISPNSELFSYILNANTNEIIVKKSNNQKTVLSIQPEKGKIFKHFWITDYKIGYITQDNANYHHFYIYDFSQDKTDNLLPFSNLKIQSIYNSLTDSNAIVLSLNIEKQNIFQCYRLAISTGKIEKIFNNIENISSWYPDLNGKILLISKSINNKTYYFFRNTEQDTFKPLCTVNLEETFEPCYYDVALNKINTVTNINTDNTIVQDYSFIPFKPIKTVFNLNQNDAECNTFIYKNTCLQVFNDNESSYIHTENKKLANIFKILSQKYFGKSVKLLAYNPIKAVGIFNIGNSQVANTIIWANLNTQDTKLLLPKKSNLPSQLLSNNQKVQFYSFDSVLITAFIAQPHSQKPQQLPFIVIPNSGAYLKHYSNYDPLVQLLVSRGFGVFMVNSRGTNGFGKHFKALGNKEWGNNKQKDIAWGVKWLIKNKYAAKHKIGLWGSNYGGYSTLMQLIQYPELYQCGLSYSGIYNLFEYLGNLSPELAALQTRLYQSIGNPKTDSALLAYASPVLNVKKLNKPLFIYQTKNDVFTDPKDCKTIVNHLQSKGIEVIWLNFENEGKTIRQESNRNYFLQEAIGFFEKQLK